MTVEGQQGQQDQTQGQAQQQQQVYDTQGQQQQTQADDLVISRAQLERWGITDKEKLQNFIEKTPLIYNEYGKTLEQRKQQTQQQKVASQTTQKSAARSHREMVIEKAMREHIAAGGEPAAFFAALTEAVEENAVTKAEERAIKLLQEKDLADQQDRAGHDRFWADPANADLKDAYYTMHNLVVKEGMRPDKAAAMVRKYGLKDNEKVRPKQYGGAGLNSAHYEGNRDDPGRSRQKEPAVESALKALKELRKKPPGERGVKALNGLFKGSQGGWS